MNTLHKWSVFARDFLDALREIGVNIRELKSEIQTVLEKHKVDVDAIEKQKAFPAQITASVSFESQEVNRYYADHNKPNSLQWWTFVLTGFTLIAVAVYAYIAGLQHGDFLESNRINRESLESVQRAFVNFKEVNFEVGYRLVAPYDKIWKISAIWQNSGTTPAILIARYIGAGDEEAHGPSLDHFVGPVEERITIEGEIGPRSERRIGPVEKTESLVFGGLTFTPANREKIARVLKLGRFCIWGWVIYKDVFPNSATRLTEFCSHMTGGGTEKGIGIAPDIQACTEHNCTDQHCKDYNAMMQLLP